MNAAEAVSLTAGQRAALARLTCGTEQPGSVALLCGPPGTGTTTVLARLAATWSRGGRSCGLRRLADWLPDVAAGVPLPDVVIADESHVADTDALGRLVVACRSRQPAAAVVLGGTGRLLTLLARDRDLERAVGLRATLHPFTAAETGRLVEPILPGGASSAPVSDIVRTIHEIAAGIPGAAVALAEVAAVVAGSRTDGRLHVADVELIHRRLSLQAA